MMKKNAFAFLAVLILPAVFLAPTTMAAGRQGHAVKKDESLRRGENRPTLDPNQFSDPAVREAYRIAKEIPWVLDSIYCYCSCEESFGHKSLLSCYVTTHAAL